MNTKDLPLYRYLRIAFTAFCGIVAVLLVVLWVRSYWWNDIFFKRAGSINQTTTTFGSNNGAVYFIRRTIPNLVSGGTGLGLSLSLNDPYGPQANTPPMHGWRLGGAEASVASKRFEWTISSVKQKVMLPYWGPILFFATLAATPWVRWRFSLRTLLLAITLVAVVLGVVVWLMR